MAEALPRMKKMRSAHRGSVTRILTQIYESLESTEQPNLARLRQQKQSLSGKLETLSKLDDELTELVDEDELDNEISQADQYREKIQMAIIDIDQALRKCTIRSTSPEAVTLRRDIVTETNERDETSPTIRTVEVTDPPLEEPPTPTIMDTTDALPMDTTTTVDVTTATIDPVSLTEPPVSVPIPRVKLPKLSLRRFNGDITKWASFWDSFDSAIHSNASLSGVDKFNYLNSLLESTPLSA